MQDYSWEDHGFSLVNRLYPDVGQMLDEKFQMAYNLTYNTMATHKDVDTSMLRRAIWNYIHCMFGIRSVPGYFHNNCCCAQPVCIITHFFTLWSAGMMTMIMER